MHLTDSSLRFHRSLSRHTMIYIRTICRSPMPFPVVAAVFVLGTLLYCKHRHRFCRGPWRGKKKKKKKKEEEKERRKKNDPIALWPILSIQQHRADTVAVSRSTEHLTQDFSFTCLGKSCCISTRGSPAPSTVVFAADKRGRHAKSTSEPALWSIRWRDQYPTP